MSNNPFENQPPQNPYASPPPNAPGPMAPGSDHSISGDANMVWQVRLLGIFQIVLGVLELVMGCCAFLVTGIFTFGGLEKDPELWFISIFYGVIAVVLLSIAALRILSGFNCLYFKGRILTIVSLLVGLGTSLTCYCALFSIGVGVYGLVVLLHPAVIQAYEMRRQGRDVREILNSYGLS